MPTTCKTCDFRLLFCTKFPDNFSITKVPNIILLQILLDPDWHVACGEESKEIAIQNERMFGALEAMYPRASNIPPK
jgi:hypothetical protein